MRMKALLLVLVLLFPAVFPARAQTPTLRESDRIRLAEAFRLADAVQNDVWSSWSDAPFAVLLVTPEYEFLVRHPRPSDDFVNAGFDSLLQSPVYVRDRVFAPGLLATFPAVGGVPTVVVGQPEHTGKSSTFWVITLLHEHFHQLQMAQPDYYEAVAALDLSGDDQTGMWMLNYPFPYDATIINERFSAYRVALVDAIASLGSEKQETALLELGAARERLRTALSERDYRYLRFQTWQEGIARYIESRVANVAAQGYEPLEEFRVLDDFIPYDVAFDSLAAALDRELETLSLSDRKRVAFYAIGAAEALLLDALQPAWRERYFVDKFRLEQVGGK